MKKTILQTHIDLLKECKRQNQMLEKLIELNMKDMQSIVDQRDWFYERYRQLKDKDLANVKELFKTAMELARKYKDERDKCQIEHDRALKAWTEAVADRTNALLERDEYKIGYDRYEKIRRLSPMQFHQLYEKNLKTGEHFDTLVDKL